jgi:sugar O-acyltransferase (sialic acid O-acetyltransferase NeuD family)
MSHELLIYGASGHAKVIIDIVERLGIYQIIGLLDDDPVQRGREFFGYRVLGGTEILVAHDRCAVVIAIGNNAVRKQLQEQAQALEYALVTAIHPSAQLARDVLVGPGAVIMAQVAINSGTRVGAGAIVNTGATVDHDCRIGEFAHISPGVHLAGNVTVGPLTHVGIGACARPGVHIGADSIVGAGAAVIQDVPDRVVAMGVPARVVKSREKGG